MTAIALYAALKFWLPMVTAFILICKGYTSGVNKLTTWADKLLNNHLSHIQTATEATAATMLTHAAKSALLLEEIRTDGSAAALSVAQVATNLKDAERRSTERQTEILRDLAILKDRQ